MHCYHTSTMTSETLTPEEAAIASGRTLRTIQNWLKSGRISGRQAGRFWQIKLSDLEALRPGSAERWAKIKHQRQLEQVRRQLRETDGIVGELLDTAKKTAEKGRKR